MNFESFFRQPSPESEKLDLVNKLEQMGLTTSFIETEAGTVLYAAPNNVSLPTEITDKLLQYDSEVVTEYPSLDVGRKDCAEVAGSAVRDLEPFFEKKGYAIYTIGSGSGETLLPFFKDLGYGHHIINIIEGENIAAAIDLTAGYTLDRGAGNYSLFVLAATTVDDVEKYLSEMTGSRWEAR